MFGGLHIEKALWETIGDILTSSRLTNILSDATVFTTGKADSHLNLLTSLAFVAIIKLQLLPFLQHEAYQLMNTTSSQKPFDMWRKETVETSPTFYFWDLILRLEMQILIFNISIRKNNFHLYIAYLESLVFLFFALYHQNYSRWISVHLKDMKSLTDEIHLQFMENFTVRKTNNRFPNLPIDQVHEQQNAKLKGKGGIIGLTENPSSLQKRSCNRV